MPRTTIVPNHGFPNWISCQLNWPNGTSVLLTELLDENVLYLGADKLRLLKRFIKFVKFNEFSEICQIQQNSVI